MGRILVVDDEERHLNSVFRIFMDSEHNIDFALNGEEALLHLNRFQPDLIILDIMMPVKDGYEVCRKVKSDKNTSEVKILILTARNSIEDRLEGIRLEADDYMSKPYNAEELLARAERLIRIKKKQSLFDRELTAMRNRVGIQKDIIPICCSCKNIRDENENWHQMEAYLRDHFHLNFSHGICPECAATLYPELDLLVNREKSSPINGSLKNDQASGNPEPLNPS